jgi:hypothetical protein
LDSCTHHGKDSLADWASFVIMAAYDFPDERSDEAERFAQSFNDAANG